jgi:hypothetical protein
MSFATTIIKAFELGHKARLTQTDIINPFTNNIYKQAFKDGAEFGFLGFTGIDYWDNIKDSKLYIKVNNANKGAVLC